MSDDRPSRTRRTTRQRSAVERGLERADGFRTAQELHDDLRREGAGVGLTTVYRTLQLLVEDGDVDVLQRGDGEAMYRRCERDEHHHHLICRSCRRSVEVQAAEVESWAERIAGRHGFTSVTHVAELFGLCGSCRPS